MSEIRDRYRRRADMFATKVEAVPPDAWERQSPCPEWTARDVVRHVVDSSTYFLGMVDRGDINLPSVDEDPPAAWKAIRAAIEAAIDDEVAANTVLEGPMGTNTFVERADRYLTFDLVVHAWDLARAAGIDESLGTDDVREVRTQAEEMGELGRQMGAFGPEIDISDAADEQTRMLALVGRRS